MSTAYTLARYIERMLGTPWGGGAEWSIHVAREPVGPESVITLYDTPGLDPDMAEGVELRMPQVQVRVRSPDYLAAFAMQERIRAILLVGVDTVINREEVEREIGESRFLNIAPIAGILSIGRDENDRHIVVANYQAIRQQEPVT